MTDERLKQLFEVSASGYDSISNDKRLIRDRLISDSDVLEILNNPTLSGKSPELYVGVNIFDRLVIPGTQTDVKNYICYEVDDIDESYSKEILITKVITFMAVCDETEADTVYGVARHDLLGYLVKDLFNWSNLLGLHIKKVYDVADVSTNGYCYRTIKFKSVSINGLKSGLKVNSHDKGNS